MDKQQVALTDIAIERRLPYRKVFDLALRGQLGEVVRVGTRLYILRPQDGGSVLVGEPK